MRRITCALGTLAVFACIATGAIAADPPATKAAQPSTPRSPAGNFMRVGPILPVEALSDSVLALDDDRVLRLLNRTRRELHNRALREEIYRKMALGLATELDRTYFLGPREFIQGFRVFTDAELRQFHSELRSLAADRSLLTGSNELEVIYEDPPEAQDPLLPHVPASETNILTAANAVVAIVDKDVLTPVTGGYSISDERFTTINGDFYLCDFAALYGLPRLNILGTGFLIEGGIIVTAAHVASYENFIEEARFVFDYKVSEPGEPITFFSTEQVYQGSAEIYKVADDYGREYAIIQLETTPPAEKYPPLTLRSSGKLPDDADLFTIGHPLGLPQMYTGPKQPHENFPCVYFTAALDTYDYSSGSPVINVKTGEVEGIVAGGGKEFQSYCDCEAPAASTAEDGLSTSTITRATLVADLLARPDEIVVVNQTEVPAIVKTGELHGVAVGESTTIPHAEKIYLLQLPATTEPGPLADILYQCRIQYKPNPGETWHIVEGEDEYTLTMVRCVEETP